MSVTHKRAVVIMVVSTWFYPVYVTLAMLMVLIHIPRKEMKYYFIYGFLLGGLGDVLVVFLFQNVLSIIWFKNQGIFYVLGQHFLSPPSWTLTIMLFLYFLPNRRWFMYPYVLTWAAFSVGYGYIVRNAGLFDFLPWFYPFPSFLVFLFWWIIVTWTFLKTGSHGS